MNKQRLLVISPNSGLEINNVSREVFASGTCFCSGPDILPVFYGSFFSADSSFIVVVICSLVFARKAFDLRCFEP